jgi:hypothetical protein
VEFKLIGQEADKDLVPYPAKILAMYEDINGEFKVLVHSVEYKTDRNVEGAYGDSRLVCHYHLEFNNRGDPNVFSLPFKDIVKCIVGYESVKYREPLISRVTRPAEQKKHTVMMIVPKEELARLFLDWMKEIRTRQDTMDGKERNWLQW